MLKQREKKDRVKFEKPIKLGNYLADEKQVEVHYELEREHPSKPGDVFVITKYRKVEYDYI